MVQGAPVGKKNFNLVIVGDMSVGKTSIMNQYVTRKFNESLAATTGVGFMCANYTSKESQEKCKIKIWDTAGQDSCRKLVPSYFRQADGIIFTFDLTQASSFNNLPDWILAA